MAKATSTIAPAPTTTADARDTALETLLEGASEHSEALLESLALLQALRQSGALDLLLALFQKSDDVLRIVMDTLAQPAYGDGLKNAVTLTQSLSMLDEPTMATTQRMVLGGLRAFAGASPPAKPLGILDLVRALRDPDVSAGQIGRAHV